MRDLGPLGRRLLASFIFVALAAVLIVTVAALIGSQRGIAASSARQDVAEEVALRAAQAYLRAGGWEQADLAAVSTFAEQQGLRVQIRDEAGRSLLRGAGPAGGYEQPVVVGKTEVGTVRVGFGGTAEQAGQGIAWRWIITATVLALVLAVLAGWWVARAITRPVVGLTQAAAAFAHGDRAARADIAAPGEIGELARTFNDAAEMITRQEQLRRNLSGDVAHELRTPLTALMAGLEEMRDGLVPADEAALTRLHDQTVRLQGVVTDLAALAEAEAPALRAQMGRIDVAQVAQRSSQAHAAQLRAAGVELREQSSGPVWAQGDPDRLEQVIGNLLANAARYCRSGDTVSVGTRTDGQFVVLDVADSGPGVPPEDLEHIFERFWRGDVDAGGSGIGLAVVQALVRAQGGTVEALSDGDSGLTVRVRLQAGD